MYQTINDASKISDMFSKGMMDIYFTVIPPRDDEEKINHYYRLTFGGSSWDSTFLSSIKDDMHRTHVKIGSIKGTDNFGKLFTVLQGEYWSPNGEARELIMKSGASHTSMSIGDIVHDRKEDQWYICDTFGFTVIGGEMA